MKFNKDMFINTKLSTLINRYPFVTSYFKDNNLDILNKEELTIKEFFACFSEDELEDRAIDCNLHYEQIANYIEQMKEFLGEEEKIDLISILPGRNKDKEKESFKRLDISKGEIICIVGPTGSGKSRLLADIEWVAQEDTPSERTVLVNGRTAESKWRFSTSNKLVAQISQNMNFVMDLSVYEFIKLHAESRMVKEQEKIIKRIIESANQLAGESFSPDTAITSLSGGQSRALMIADTAILSKSPIILIDEIENAGIDRKLALNLLLSEEKIVLMATHDPILALMGDKRIVIKNGGINKIIKTSEKEREILSTLEELDKKLLSYRHKLRMGEILNK